MKLKDVEAVFRSLNAADVRYLVAGGLAVNAHGYQRLTGDIDLVIQLKRKNVEDASRALTELNYRPLAPVQMSELADEKKRTEWIQTKNMKVFGLANDDAQKPTIDLFVTEPFDFAREYELALIAEVATGVEVRFVSIPTLIEMKELAGRPRDKDDIQHLKWLLEETQ